jgi:hypothetical protein
MTITIKKSINLTLILVTFLTGFASFGSVTTRAYNFNQYPIACPSDFPYCDYRPISNSTNYCYLPIDVIATDCITNDSKYYSPIQQNKTSFNNYNAQYYGNFNCYYYSNKCNSTTYQTPTTYYETYYTPTKNTYNTDYCSYLNTQYNEYCTNIAVSPPKTYDIPNEQYYPTNTDPLRNCYLNTNNCYGGIVNNNTASYSFDSYPYSDQYSFRNDQYSNMVESNPDYYSLSNDYITSINQGSYNFSDDMYYYAG